MGRVKKQVLAPIPEGRIETPSNDVELTSDVASKIAAEQASEPQTEQEPPYPHKTGYLRLKCSCGNICNISDQLIEDGLHWTMLFDNDHYLRLNCPNCKVEMKMYLEELKDELSQESNTE
jgi:hypothetical protein